MCQNGEKSILYIFLFHVLFPCPPFSVFQKSLSLYLRYFFPFRLKDNQTHSAKYGEPFTWGKFRLTVAFCLSDDYPSDLWLNPHRGEKV
jgi:hypothetical protein